MLVKKMIMGTIGVGDATLISSNDAANTSFVVGLFFDRLFV